MNEAPHEATVSRFAAVAAGVVLGAISLGLTAMTVVAVFRQIQWGHFPSASWLAMTVVMAALALGLGRVAWRLIANRPTKHGSLFSPGALRAFAFFWLVGALFLAFIMVHEHTLDPLGGLAGALAIATGSWRYSLRLRKLERNVAL